MHPHLSWIFALLLCGGLIVQGTGCTSSKEAEDTSSSPSQRERSGPDLAPPAEEVRTIQLYKGENERSLPVVTLKSEESLTLEFDLIEQSGRPLSVYFYHADRTWKRDLTDSQILDSFQDDHLTNYRSSRGTRVDYTHYVYRFPNEDVGFRISGNYIVRVTERGRRDSVLFEEAFFVAEGTGSLQTRVESIPVPGQQAPSLRPTAHYTPPSEIRGDPFGYSVCFIRDGRLPAARCEDQPRLVNQPRLEFELPRDRAFGPVTAEYGLDLSTLQPSNQIARIDRTTTPIQAQLDPDYARFGETRTRVDVNGQIVIRGALQSLADPALRAEYVKTTFAFVPSNKNPYRSELVIGGSVSDATARRETVMTWREQQGQYEGTILLKQGQYDYIYATSDPTFREEMKRSLRPRPGDYVTFVYYQDPNYTTDRLLRVENFTP